ncbi:hypothetical protein OROHE_007476 [Orobanche hederae]
MLGFDYIIRGCRACGLGCNFQFQRLVESIRFIGDEICYRAKYCKFGCVEYTDQDIVYSQKNGGVALREDVVVNNVRPDLTCGRHSLLGRCLCV